MHGGTCADADRTRDALKERIGVAESSLLYCQYVEGQCCMCPFVRVRVRVRVRMRVRVMCAHWEQVSSMD